MLMTDNTIKKQHNRVLWEKVFKDMVADWNNRAASNLQQKSLIKIKELIGDLAEKMQKNE